MHSETLYVEINKPGSKTEVNAIQVWDMDRKLQSLQKDYMKEGAVVRRIDRQSYLDARKSK